MKKLTLLLFAILLLNCPEKISAQSWLYSPPQPFSDSPSHKANAHLGYAYGLGWIVLWEQYTDTTSTAIWYKKYLTGDDPVELIAEPGIHFRRPTLIRYWNDYTSLIIFEKVNNGKSHIYFIEVSINGSQSDTIPFWTSGNQNHELTTGIDSQGRYRLAWISDGYLLTSREIVNNGASSFSSPDTVATGNLKQPTFTTLNYMMLFWLEEESQLKSLRCSEELEPSGWRTPKTIITEPEINKKNNRWTHDGVVSWSYKDDEQWRMNNYHGDYNYGLFYPLSLVNDEPIDFAAWSSWIPVKSGILDLEFYTLAYPKVVGDYRDIFVFESFWAGNGELHQLSYLNTACRNPSYHDGEAGPNYGIYIYVIWEAEIEGYWQLYYSRFSFSWSGIEENELATQVGISPNPAGEKIVISNKNELPLVVRIFDITGRLMFEKSFQNNELNIQVENWPKGMYLVNINSDGTNFSRKLIVR